MLQAKVKKEDFLKGLAQTSNIAGKFHSMPILSNVLLESQDGKLVLSATDLEITFQAFYECEVGGEGRITVPAKTLIDTVKGMGDEYISLTETENQTLEVANESFKGSIYGLSADDFPRLAPFQDAEVDMAEFSGEALVDAVGKTINSVSTNTSNFNLAGIYWIKEAKDGEGETVRLVSSDSNRLNVATIRPADIEKFKPEQGVLVSRKGLAELRGLADGAESVMIGINTANQLACRTEGSVLIMRLLEGKFPDYNTLMPPDPTVTLEMNRRDVSDTLKRMTPMNSPKFRVVFFRFSQDSVLVTIENPEVGHAEERLPVDYSGEEMVVGFDPRHILDALGSIRSERFRISYVDQKTPVVLTAHDDPGWLCIVSTISPKDSAATRAG
ncbi:MAG: DNA polymerase III subunit beta [Deltaproteobacteria bacterium]|jgi:DNA polymerase-3 subunit beta|nr:DNA polymerase III subunit beta [Deltaproteobacteria bacterium]